MDSMESLYMAPITIGSILFVLGGFLMILSFIIYLWAITNTKQKIIIAILIFMLIYYSYCLEARSKYSPTMYEPLVTLNNYSE